MKEEMSFENRERWSLIGISVPKRPWQKFLS